MEPRKIIAFAGPKTCGKSTASKVLLEEGFVRVSFAEPIRRMLLALGIESRYLNEDKEVPIPHLGVTGRFLMQSLGTNWGRDLVSPDIWVHFAKRHFAGMSASLVFDDVRFDNEARVIRELGGMVVELTRPGVDSYTGEHASERGISPHLFTHRFYCVSVPTLELLVRSLIST